MLVSCRWLVLFITFSWALFALAADTTSSNGLVDGERQEVAGYLARIEKNNPEEVAEVLQRAEQFFLNEGMRQDFSPVVLVLHGPEVAIFFRDNYLRYRPIVDLAAKLSALKVVDIKVCETQSHGLGLDLKTLLPFVGTVPVGPVEERRLIEIEKYIYF
ncbi:MAG: acyl-CoA transferase [Gammaproteobacteria bacterium]|nr:MAG: acyl-CoA transferase [Gammaproteobacteria bacterium]